MPLFVAAYLWACRLVLGVAPTVDGRRWSRLLIWLPFPALRSVFVLPALAWLAFIGLAVPAAMVERLGSATPSYVAVGSGSPTTGTRWVRWRRWWWSSGLRPTR